MQNTDFPLKHILHIHTINNIVNTGIAGPAFAEFVPSDPDHQHLHFGILLSVVRTTVAAETAADFNDKQITRKHCNARKHSTLNSKKM